MSKVRILFLGTPEFAKTHLEGLLSDEHFEVAAVVTQPDRPAGRKMKLTASAVKEYALKKNLRVLTPETVNTAEFCAEIRALKCESAVVVAFGQLLKEEFLSLFSKGIVNIHGSLLPRWRGAAPIQRALMAGDAETGVALQILVKKLDAGALLGVRKIPFTESDTALTVYPRLAELGKELLATEFMDYLRGNLTPIEQDESQVTYAAKITKAEAKIDWQKPAFEIVNLIRGLALGPVPYCQRRLDGSLSLLKIHRAQVRKMPPGSTWSGSTWPGEIVEMGVESFTVLTGDGNSIEIFEVQPESRSRLTVESYLKGHPAKLGEVLENG